MKNFSIDKLLTLIIFLVSYADCSATPQNDRNDPEYFKTFRKNESPKAATFVLLNKRINAEEAFYYVIYKETSDTAGFFLK